MTPGAYAAPTMQPTPADYPRRPHSAQSFTQTAPMLLNTPQRRAHVSSLTLQPSHLPPPFDGHSPYHSPSAQSPRSPSSHLSSPPASPTPHSAAAGNSNFRVCVRIRPPHPSEISDPEWRETILYGDDGRTLRINEAGVADTDSASDLSQYATQSYSFDAVFPPHSQQVDVYAATAQDAVQSVLAGYNATVLAYGQTGSGKTFTMEGYDDVELQGMIPRAVADLFHSIHSTSSPQSHFLVRASYIQIYNEAITDLLMANGNSGSGSGSGGLLIREDAVRGVFVGGLSEWVVRNVREVMELLRRGTARRATSATKMNESSSRSHAVFIINVEQNNRQPHTPTSAPSPAAAASSFLSAKLNLVDLAGSERITLSGAKGARLEETKAINQSLSALANVIAALIKHRPHIPYRDSKLTRLLQSSIGGNTRTCLLACLSPSPAHYNENVSSLSFASRARRVQNRVEVNEVGVDGRPSVLRKYEKELVRLRTELQQRRDNVVDVRRLIAAEDEKRKAEADREEQKGRVKALSESLVKEKALKRRLQQQIEQMNGVMIAGGGKSREMEQRVAELQERWEEAEREREKLRAERATSGQYEQLVEAQREVIRRMSAGLEKREDERRKCEEQVSEWQSKCRAMEREYDRMEARYLRLKNRVAERGGAADDEDDEDDGEEDSVSGGTGGQAGSNRYSVLVTPYENEDSDLRADEYDDADEPATRHNSSGPLSTIQPVQQARHDEQYSVLRRQYRRQQEERAALLVILEQKMGTMVDDIDRSITQRDGGEQAKHEVDKLRRLLAASITALRYAQNDKAAIRDEEKEQTSQTAVDEQDEALIRPPYVATAPVSLDRRADGSTTSASPPPPPPPRSTQVSSVSPLSVNIVLPTSQRHVTASDMATWSPFPVSPSPLSPSPPSPAPASPLTPSAPSSVATLESLQASLRAGREDFARLQQRLAQR